MPLVSGADAEGWQLHSGTKRGTLLRSKTQLRRRTWVRSRSTKEEDATWFSLPQWTQDQVVSLAVGRWGVWILLRNLKVGAHALVIAAVDEWVLL